MIAKTLTFGLGQLSGYDKKTKTLIPLEDDKRKLIYREIQQGFRDFAKLCNYQTSVFYSAKILNVELKDLGMNTGYVPFLEKMKLDTTLTPMR